MSAWFIQSILRRVAPAYVEAGLALWLWNPLVLNEGVINGHNDLVLWAVTLAGIWLLVRGRALPGLLVLVAAGLIKVTAWVVIPVPAAIGSRRSRSDHGPARGCRTAPEAANCRSGCVHASRCHPAAEMCTWQPSPYCCRRLPRWCWSGTGGGKRHSRISNE